MPYRGDSELQRDVPVSPSDGPGRVHSQQKARGMNERSQDKPGRGRGRPYVMAMVLGTALTALAGGQASASLADPGSALFAVEDLSRYCTTCWRNAHLHPDCWTDCTQEVFCRLLERISPEAWDRILGDDGLERREFLRAIDAVKKRTQRARKLSGLGGDEVADRRGDDQTRQASDREALVHAADQVLTPRQRRIILQSLDGASVADMARELKVPAERISDEKYKAIRKLRQRLAEADAEPAGTT